MIAIWKRAAYEKQNYNRIITNRHLAENVVGVIAQVGFHNACCTIWKPVSRHDSLETGSLLQAHPIRQCCFLRDG